MIKITKKTENNFELIALFDSKTMDMNIIKKQNSITEFVSKKVAYIYLGKKEKFTDKSMRAVAKIIAKLNARNYDVSVESFSTGKVSQAQVVNNFVIEEEFINGEIYNVKTDEKKKKKTLSLINVSNEGKEKYKESKIHAESMTYVRNFQITPPNELTSESFAAAVGKDFSKIKNVSVKVLERKEITKLKMGLFLSVNLGSAFEPRVVVLEYKGNPSSKEKTVIVAKGITFDAGGYSIKTGSHMGGMKFDMSGAAIAAGAMKSISQFKPKKNISVVMMLTDNMINSIALKPDDVWTAMNGKTVEINNTDAEGRLAMADGLTYGAKNLNATRLIDIATLTGAVLSALGHTYTGVWSTTEKGWDDISKAAKESDELVWRMPLHKDFIKYMKGSKVADLKNTALDGMGGSSTAAMFLGNFAEDVEYIHLDVAGTADIDGVPMAAMTRTLTKVAK